MSNLSAWVYQEDLTQSEVRDAHRRSCAAGLDSRSQGTDRALSDQSLAFPSPASSSVKVEEITPALWAAVMIQCGKSLCSSWYSFIFGKGRQLQYPTWGIVHLLLRRTTLTFSSNLAPRVSQAKPPQSESILFSFLSRTFD